MSTYNEANHRRKRGQQGRSTKPQRPTLTAEDARADYLRRQALAEDLKLVKERRK